MKFKIFEYQLIDGRRNIVGADRHYDIFMRSTGRDDIGQFTEYRGSRNSVLMYLRPFSKDFSGLIGRHSEEREVTEYIERTDETITTIVEDDDYPNTPFICFPRLHAIVVLDGAKISADSAMARLHQILVHRRNIFLTYGTFKEALDLRRAVSRFKLTEVTFEVLPVNPHTGPLGQRLDAARAKDHIRRILGKVEGTKSNPLALNGGFLNEVQQLQQSGHAKVGFKGFGDNDIAVEVTKPKHAHDMSDADEENLAPGEQVDVKVEVPGSRLDYPFKNATFTQLRTIIRRLLGRLDDKV